MAFKGKALIDSARIKAEIARIQKISAGINVYFAKYERLPGLEDDGSFDPAEGSRALYDDLTKEGILREGDFKSSAPEGQGTWWNFIGCEDKGTYWAPESLNAAHYICIARTNTPTKNFPGGNPRDFKMDAKMLCSIETVLDDKNISGGDGRGVTPTADSTGSGTLDPNWNCSSNNNSGNEMIYLYRVF